MNSAPGKLILGTRASPLALAQAQIAKETFLAAGVTSVEVSRIHTSGDKRLDVALGRGLAGTLEKGLFTRELEEALLGGDIDVAVHSLKDLPVDLPAGLVVGAVLPRARVDDILLSKHSGSLGGLPPGAVVATSSERRKLQVLATRPDLQLREIRGNVGTRMRKVLADPDFSGLILAAAGLERLGFDLSAGELEVEDGMFHVSSLWPTVLPAPGQAAIGLEIRASSEEVTKLVHRVNHRNSWCCVQGERAVLAALGGGCHAALGVRSAISGDTLELHGRFFPDGSAIPVESTVAGPSADPEALGALLAKRLQTLANPKNK